MRALPAFLRWGVWGAAAVLSLPSGAEPFVPQGDAAVVQRLPYRIDAAERQRRAALARDPAQLALAAATAREALRRARVHGDPRELGAAQAALAPWWAQDDAPAQAVLLRARVRQAQHDFDAALTDLHRLLGRPALAPEDRAQALLDAAALHQLRADLPQARVLCEQLRAWAPLQASACLAELDSLSGQAQAAAQVLARLGSDRSTAPWLALMRAELAERLGDDAAAPRLYRLALAGEDEVYTRAALADWLLARQRAAEALALLERKDMVHGNIRPQYISYRACDRSYVLLDRLNDVAPQLVSQHCRRRPRTIPHRAARQVDRPDDIDLRPRLAGLGGVVFGGQSQRRRKQPQPTKEPAQPRIDGCCDAQTNSLGLAYRPPRSLLFDKPRQRNVPLGDALCVVRLQ